MSQKLLTLALGFVVTVTLCGCVGNDAGTASPGSEDDHSSRVHEGEQTDVHPTEGPHGGDLIELGDEAYHAELSHDEQSHAVVVHILDAAGKNDVPIDQSEIVLQIFKDGEFVEYTLKAAGAALPVAEFSLIDENLCNLMHAEDLRGRLNVTIDGESYKGVIEHHGGEHDGHDH
jgi:hypothetical protein